MLMGVLVIVTGCSDKSETPEEILKLVEKEHDQLKSVVIEQEQIEHLQDGLSYTATEQHDFENGIYLSVLDEGEVQVYNDKDGSLFVVNGEKIDQSHEGFIVQEFKMNYEIESQRNPLKQLKEFDDNIYSKFTLSNRGENNIFTYTGTDEEKATLVKGIVWSSYYQANSFTDSFQELDLNDVELKITAKTNKETNLLSSFDIYIKYSTPPQFNTRNVEYMTKNSYSQYNTVKAIEKPVVQEEAISEEGNGLSESEIALYEKEAGQYVDALIRATVFQDEIGYVELVPGNLSDEEKLDEGEMQKSFFSEIYKQNTMENMRDTGVTEEQVSAYAEAFLTALSKTKYGITKSHMQNDGTFQVTVSIQGINNSLLNDQVGEQLAAEYHAGKLSDDDLLNRNIELIIEAYNENVTILPPRDAIVDVMRNDDGAYLVFMQDQYLMMFVQ